MWPRSGGPSTLTPRPVAKPRPRRTLLAVITPWPVPSRAAERATALAAPLAEADVDASDSRDIRVPRRELRLPKARQEPMNVACDAPPSAARPPAAPAPLPASCSAATWPSRWLSALSAPERAIRRVQDDDGRLAGAAVPSCCLTAALLNAQHTSIAPLVLAVAQGQFVRPEDTTCAALPPDSHTPRRAPLTARRAGYAAPRLAHRTLRSPFSVPCL
jgi:hypothetical protein